jgi:hypothetical protein
MTDADRRRLRAPAEDGAALIEPAPSELTEVLRQNQRTSNEGLYDLQGRRLDHMAQSARGELCEKARRFTCRYRDIRFVPELTSATPFILSGHQPELFHPGVWLKTFLLSALGKKTRAVAINLIVDSDLVRKTAIAVPTAGRSPAAEHIAYDAGGEAVPYEERTILDDWLLRSFAVRVRAACDSYGIIKGHSQLIVNELWRETLQGTMQNPRLGLALAEMRHRLESRVGLETLELPLSVVARRHDFRWFALHLLAQLPRLWRIYNKALEEYRQVNRIRSATHPVPSLQEHDDWLEAPFMVWNSADPRRRHLFVQQTRSGLVVSDRQGLRLALDITADSPPDKAIEQLADAEARGIKIRPRALITTMYARLVLSDLFIHGIGGAKYDELTDLIIRRFFGIEPPAYVTATATFRLPIERPDVPREDVRSAAQRIRDVRHRPESFLRDPRVMRDAALAQPLQDLANEKRDYLAKHDLRHCPQEVFDRLDRLNRAMHDLLHPVEDQLRAEHLQLIEQWKQSQLLASREFSFCLFPSEILPARLLDLCKVSS